MKKVLQVLVIMSLVSLTAGCGNVSLQGDAMTAAQQSTLDALQAVQRANADPATPMWQKAYLQDNFLQWRYYVRAAKKDAAWGPKLPGEE